MHMYISSLPGSAYNGNTEDIVVFFVRHHIPLAGCILFVLGKHAASQK